MSQRSRYLQNFVAWLLLGLVCFALNRYTNSDVALSNLFYDAETSRFPLKDNHSLTLLFHDSLRWLTVLIWLGLLFVAILPKSDAAARREILKILAISLLAAVIVSVLKSSLLWQRTH